MPYTDSSPHGSPSALAPSSGRSLERPDYAGYPPCGEPLGYPRGTNWDSGNSTQYWSVLLRRKGTLSLMALFGAMAALLLTRVESRVYRARTLVEIEGLNRDFLNIRDVSPTASAENFQSPDSNIRTQTMILQSRPVLARALDKMDLEKRLLANNEQTDLAAAWGGSVLPWRRTLPKREAISARDRALTAAAAGLKVRAEPNTRLIEVTFDSTDARVAADFVNAIIAAFTELSLEQRSESSRNTSEWLTRQLADVKAKLEKDEDALQRYVSASNLTFVSDNNSNAAEERLRQIQLELSKAQADRVEKQSRYEMAVTGPAESLPQVVDDPVLKEYQIQLTTLRRQLAELSSRFTPKHPKVVEVEAQIAAVEAALEKKRSHIVSRIRTDFQESSRREKLLSAEYSAQTEVVSRQAYKLAHYSVLKREVDTTRQLYDTMIQRVREAGLASAMQASDTHVIESARPPRLPYKPNLLLNLALGLVSGVCIGAAWIVRRARSYRGIDEPGSLAFELNLPELGVIPSGDMNDSPARRLLGKSESQVPSIVGRSRLELATWQQRPSAMAESFRCTLTSILLSEKDGVRPRVIVLSSANPGEGKTTVISNLAIALALIDRRVLLVDGDMRKPRLHEIFAADNSVGLAEALAGGSSVSIQKTRIPNLFLLPSGKRVDEKLVFTSRLGELLRELEANFDTILIDTPPLLTMPDARLMGHHADAVILVVAQHTTRDAVLMAQQRLTEDGSHLLGTILNNWNPKTSVYGCREYGEYYKDYYWRQ